MSSPNVAIIGSGISGLTSAYYLTKAGVNVTVFEKNDYVGGHTATKTVTVDQVDYDIDTGFIVFNDWTYPNFIRLMDELKVESQKTEMSFSVKDKGFEYSGSNLDTVFAQRRNLFSPSFIRMTLDILKFNKQAILDLDNDKYEEGITLGDYLDQAGYSDRFMSDYLIPMGSAIWSCSGQSMADFPLTFFVQFFKNHGLLSIKNRPQWHVIKGGSKQYIKPLTASFKDKIRLNSNIDSISRNHEGVSITHKGGETEIFDEVIFACHSDQAIALLADACEDEKDVVGGIAYQANEVVLHTDHSVLPERKKAWSAWNYRLTHDDIRPASVSYYMNLLQGLDCEPHFCVTLNDTAQIDPQKILATYHYHHPLFNLTTQRNQGLWKSVNGKKSTWFCGAYWRNGFHEDGVFSALRVVKSFCDQHDIETDWQVLS